MAEVKKDIAWPREVWPPGFTKPFDLAPLIPRLKARMDEMLAAGLPIPLVWKHDDRAVPGKEAQVLLSQGDGRLKLGDVTGGVIDEDGDLVSVFDVPDEKDREQ